MAHLLKYEGGRRVFLNIDESVGIGGVNRPDDVLLVQWILSRALKSGEALGQPLSLDGIYGPMTDYHLARYLLKQSSWIRMYGAKLEEKQLVPISYDASGVNQDTLMSWLDNGVSVLERELADVLAKMPARLKAILEKNVWVGNKGKMPTPFAR